MFTVSNVEFLKANDASPRQGLSQFFSPLIGTTALAPSGARDARELVVFEGEAK